MNCAVYTYKVYTLYIEMVLKLPWLPLQLDEKSPVRLLERNEL